MNKMTFQEFEGVMSFDVGKIKSRSGLEINFCIDNSNIYQESWMGKMKDRETGEDTYWFGLVPDGSQGYDFPTFEEFASAKVFDGSSLKEIWDSVSIWSLHGGLVEEMLPFFLK